MSKKLTIVIDNIPDELWNKYWEDQKTLAMEECGVSVEETEDIKVDALRMMQYDVDGYAELMSSAGAGHVLDTINDILNKKIHK